MRFAITGSTGLIGRALTSELRALGHHVTRVVRSYGDAAHGERAVVWHPDEGIIDQRGLEGHDVFVHLGGESIFGLWTDAKKRRIRESRVRGTTLIAGTIARLHDGPRALFSASAMGFYGDRGDVVVDESTGPGTGFLAGVAQLWEDATRPAEDAGVRVVHMRFGNVLSRNGGMLAAMLPLFRLGLGGRLGDGQQFWSWIAIHDITPALLHVLDRTELHGPVNFVAPEPVTNAEFTATLAAMMHRPAFMTVPRFAARLTPGHMGEEMLLSSTRVAPRRLLDTAYTFRFARLRAALQSLL